MSAPVKSGRQIYRDYELDGNSSSGPHKPIPGEIRTWTNWAEASIDLLSVMAGADVYADTKAALDALAGSHTNGQIGVVAYDPDVTGRGVFKLTGGVWVKFADLPNDAAASAALSETIATEKAAEAAASEANAADSEAAALSYKNTASAKAADAAESETNSAASAAAAAASRSASATSETNAAASAASAAGSTYGAGLDLTKLPNADLLNALILFTTSTSRYLGHVGQNGTWNLPALALPGGLTDNGTRVTPAAAQTIMDDLWSLADASGNAVLRAGKDGVFYAPAFSSPELVSARGSRVDIGTRLNQYLAPYGVPKTQFGAERLRDTAFRITKFRLSASTQLTVAFLGDSYTQLATRWTGPAASHLIALFGDAGGGWVGFGSSGGTSDNGNVRPSSYTYARSGSWGYATYYGVIGPDLGELSSTTAGDKITLTGPSTPVLSAANLFWKATADGVVRYRWNAGSWTTLNVQGTVGNLYTAALSTNMPASGAWTLEIEVVSGSVVLFGIDFKSAANGVRCHKLGSTGSRAQQWAAVTAAQWQAGLAALAPNLVVIMLGPNDQGAARLPADFAANLATIMDNARTACPTADILVMMPPENQRTTNTYTMAAYAAAALEVVAARDAAWIDTQQYYGVNAADYAYGSSRALFALDQLHPDPAVFGGYPLVNAFNRTIGVYS